MKNVFLFLIFTFFASHNLLLSRPPLEVKITSNQNSTPFSWAIKAIKHHRGKLTLLACGAGSLIFRYFLKKAYTEAMRDFKFDTFLKLLPYSPEKIDALEKFLTPISTQLKNDANNTHILKKRYINILKGAFAPEEKSNDIEELEKKLYECLRKNDARSQEALEHILKHANFFGESYDFLLKSHPSQNLEEIIKQNDHIMKPAFITTPPSFEWIFFNGTKNAAAQSFLTTLKIIKKVIVGCAYFFKGLFA